MLWILGKLFKITLILIIIGALLGVAVILFINPSDFKEEITNSLQDFTGRDVVVKGDLEWTFSPEFALFIEDIQINGNSNIQQATIYLDPLSVFSSSIKVHSLQVSKGNIIMDWQTAKEEKPAPSNKRVVIQKAEFNEISISFVDEEKDINWTLQNANFNVENLVLGAGSMLSPVTVQGDLIDVSNNQKYKISSTVTPEFDKQFINFDPLTITWNDTTLVGTASLSQYVQEPLFKAKLTLEQSETSEILTKLDPYFDKDQRNKDHTLSFAIDFDYYLQGKILDITQLNMSLDSGTLSGTLKLGFTSPFQANFELMSSDMDFEPLIEMAKVSFPSTPASKSFLLQWLQETTLSGKFIGKNLTFSEGLTIEQINFQTIVDKGKIQIMPFTFSAYNSMHNLSLFIDVTGDVPFIQLTEQADNVDLAVWNKFFNLTEIISGKAYIKASIEATGTNTQTLLSSLSGGVDVAFNSGRFYGINIDKLMQFQVDLIRNAFLKLTTGEVSDIKDFISSESSNWINTQKDRPYTTYNAAEFKAKFSTGVSKEATFIMDTDNYNVRATGEVNFVNDTINLNAHVLSKREYKLDVVKLARYLQESPFTIRVTGKPSSPVYGPEVRKYAITSIELILEAAMQTATTRMVEATPPNQKTDQSANELFVNSLKVLRR